MDKLLSIAFLLMFISSFVSSATQISQIISGVTDVAIVKGNNGVYAFFAVNGTAPTMTPLFFHDSATGNVTFNYPANKWGRRVEAMISSAVNTYYVSHGYCDISTGNPKRFVTPFDIATLTYGVDIVSQTESGVDCSYANGAILTYDEMRRVDLISSRFTATGTEVGFYAKIYSNNNTLICSSTDVGVTTNNTFAALRLNSTTIIRAKNNGIIQTMTISNSSTCTYPSDWGITDFNTFTFGGGINYRLFFNTLNQTSRTRYNLFTVYSSNSPGNYELYVSNSTQTSVTSRLTTTVGNEVLLDAYQNNYGTVYIIYTVGTSVYLDTFCGYDAPNVILGSTCPGENIVTPPTPQQPNLMMKIEDVGQCSTGCRIFDPNPFNVFDWLEVTILANGTIPIIDATCTGRSYGGINYAFTYNDPSHPGNFYSTQAHDSINDFVDITCNSNGTKIWGNIYVQETRIPLTSWDLKAGKQTHYDDLISIYEAPAVTKAIWTRNVHDLAIFFGNVQQSTDFNSWCWSVNSQLGTSYTVQTQTSIMSQDLGGGDWKYTILMNFDPLYVQGLTYSSGFKRYEVMCRGNEDSRVASITEQRYLNVVDACNGHYNPTKLYNTVAPVSGLYNNTFYYGQRPNYNLLYQYQDNITGDWKQTTCIGNYQLAYTNGTLMYRHLINFGVIPDFKLMTYDNNLGDYLPIGSYIFTVNCDNNNPNFCIQPAIFNKTITIINGSGCLNTPASCGTLSCSVCSNINFQCEDGQNVSVPPVCEDQICYNQSIATEDVSFPLPNGCFIYRTNLDIEGGRFTHLACEPGKDMNWYITITKSNQRIDPLSINAICDFKVYTANLSSPINQSLIYETTPIFDDAGKRFIAKIPNFSETIGCNAQYQAKATCYSDQFRRINSAFQIFDIAPNAFCVDGTQSGRCVFIRTNNDLDKGLYCDNTLTIVNNSAFCGCPSGQTRDNSTNGCSGLFGPKQVTKNDIARFLTALFNNWWLVLIILAIIILIFKRQRVEYTNQ